MSYDEYEQQRFYHRANTALDVGEAVAYGVLARELWRMSGPHPKLSDAAKAWWLSAVGFVVLAVVIIMVQGGSQSTEDYVAGKDSGSTVPSIICLVLAGVCFLAGCFCASPPSPPAPSRPQAPTPSPQQPTLPTGPAPVQTRVERSVRVVRAPATTTTHHNPTTPPAAIQSPLKDVAPTTDLVVIREHHRPPLYTEDHDGRRITDRRSFDRDLDQ